jgi:BirA family biotin operon repressor/biotin-[acetyl-CoA-carboxylase] ligase
VVAADEQTAGRGRLGRRWLAPPGTSLLVSVAFAPQTGTERLPELSPLGAHALAAAIASVTGLRAVVKYPNDVLIRGRKVAGVLGEARGGRVVLGFGVNVNVAAGLLPGDADTPPTSLLLESGEPVDRGLLLAALLEELERRYDAWSAKA